MCEYDQFLLLTWKKFQLQFLCFISNYFLLEKFFFQDLFLLKFFTNLKSAVIRTSIDCLYLQCTLTIKAGYRDFSSSVGLKKKCNIFHILIGSMMDNEFLLWIVMRKIKTVIKMAISGINADNLSCCQKRK